MDLDNVINELLWRLEDHKYRWELYVLALIENDQCGSSKVTTLGPRHH